MNVNAWLYYYQQILYINSRTVELEALLKVNFLLVMFIFSTRPCHVFRVRLCGCVRACACVRARVGTLWVYEWKETGNNYTQTGLSQTTSEEDIVSYISYRTIICYNTL